MTHHIPRSTTRGPRSALGTQWRALLDLTEPVHSQTARSVHTSMDASSVIPAREAVQPVQAGERAR